MPFAVAVTWAVPAAPIGAGLPVIVADAPTAVVDGVTVNVTGPLPTGSPGLFGVTVTTRGFVNAELTAVDCSEPLVTEIVKPCDSNAPISGALKRFLPRWSVAETALKPGPEPTAPPPLI